MVTWDECRHAFEPDGDLRDIHVQPANASVWAAALPFLVSQGLSTFRVDGEEAPLPRRPRDALRLRPGASPVLIGERDGIEYACHFFSKDDVGITFPPWKIDRPGRFASLLSFVRGLGRATGRDVLVAFGDRGDRPFLRYDLAGDDFACIAEAGGRAPDGSPAARADARSDRPLIPSAPAKHPRLAGLEVVAASGSLRNLSTARARRMTGRPANRVAPPVHDMQEDLDLVMKAAAIIKRDVEAFMADTDATLDALAGRVVALEAWRNRLERAGLSRGQPPARRRLRPIHRAARGEGEGV